MKKFVYCVMLSVLVSADEPNNVNDFESLLDDVSNIATKKSINVDYMPSVVTVIDAQTYRDAGIQTISQALDMLPGFQEQVSSMGYTITTVRGFKNPNAYFADKIKILVDGVAINNEVTGTTSFYLDFPLQLVEKIEVLRGPASTMYGGGAFYGAVNIITKLGNSKKENQIYLEGGSYGYITAGTNLYMTDNGWSIFADGYAASNDKRLYFNAQNPTDSGYSDEAMKDYSVGFKATNGGWELLARLKHETSGNFYSFEGALDPIPTRGQNHSSIYLFSQLSYKTFFDDYELQTKINYSHRTESVNANIASIAEIAGYFSAVGITMTDGFYTTENLQEDNYGFESTLNLPEIASNDILVGVGLTYDVVTHDNYFSSVENAIVASGNMAALQANPAFNYSNSDEPAYWLDPTATTVVPKGISRTNIYGYAQDLVSVTDKIDLILGLRLDNYSDVGSTLSRRAGFVYRASDETTLKLLYGSAYRAPTFTEADALGHINLRMGDPNIKPEESNTYEAVIVYSPNFYNKFILNFYYTKLHNVIDLEELYDTPIGYQNYPDRESKGVEFEYFFKTGMKHNLYFNASYTNTDYATSPDGAQANPDPSIVQRMPDISPFMAKALYIYKPTSKLSLGTAWRYYSATTQTRMPWVVSSVTAGDYKASVPAVQIFDETFTYRFTPHSQIQATIKNLFNAQVLQPSYYYGSAHEGIQREGRNYLVNYVHRF